MAESNTILNRLLDLQGTDFEVVDCKVSEEKSCGKSNIETASMSVQAVIQN